MEASDLKRLDALEDENRRLTQMYPNLSLDHKILKNVVEKSCKICESACLQLGVERYPAHSFGTLYKIIRRWGHSLSHKRVNRLYCALGLNKRRRGQEACT